MSTELHGNIDYERRLHALGQFKGHLKRVRGITFPDDEFFSFLQKPERTQQIKKLASDCGCQFAAKVSAGSMALYLALTAAGIVKMTSTSWKNYLLNFLHRLAHAHSVFGIAFSFFSRHCRTRWLTLLAF